MGDTGACGLSAHGASCDQGMPVFEVVGYYFLFNDIFNRAPVIYWSCADEFFLCFSLSSFLDWSSTYGGGGSCVIEGDVMAAHEMRHPLFCLLCDSQQLAWPGYLTNCHCHGHRNTHCDVEDRQAGRLHDGPHKHVATHCRRQSTCRRFRLSWFLHSRLLPHPGPFVDKVVVVACLPPLWAHPRRDSWLHLRS